MSDDGNLSSHEKKALRLIRAIELLRRIPCRLKDLKKELDLEERAVYNYLDAVEALGKPELLNFDLERGEKYFIRPRPTLELGAVDSVVIHAALRMMAHHSPGENLSYREALGRLTKNLPPAIHKIAMQSIEGLGQRAGERNLGNSSNLERITQAWIDRKIIEFSYQIPGKAKQVKIELEVYMIEVSRANMAVYLIGKDRLYSNEIYYQDNLKTYKLDRIQGGVKTLDKTYIIPDDFDPTEYLSSAWGIVTGDKPITVKLRFSPDAAYRILEGGYPNLIAGEPEDDGSLPVEIKVGTDDEGFALELLPWIQSWGPRVEVLEPRGLKQVWLDEAREMLARYDPGGMPPDNQYWAHTHKQRSKWQSMKEHTSEVSRLAREKASYFGEAEKAELAGKLHDIGKYGDLFQQRLKNPHLVKGLDHWSAGAHIALFDYRQIDVALVIQGHHIGLQCGAKQSLKEMKLEDLALKHPRGLRLSEADPELLIDRLKSDGITLPGPSTDLLSINSSSAAMLDTRMLFSSLVDADFLDTERTMSQGDSKFVPRPKAPELEAARALELLESSLKELSKDPTIPEKTRLLRQMLGDECKKAAQSDTRLFTLTAPTGTGKTLAMLRFALTKAMGDPNIRRIIVVLPFLSILDQTVDIYRKLFGGFGEHYLLEHHSLAGLRRDEPINDGQAMVERQKRLLSENWDAPIIITTSVQFLESLHASRTSACRKLHNIAGSVVLFDEVQTLPVHLAVPTLKTLSQLASDKYGCTVVFSTATQPAFDKLHSKVLMGEPSAGWQPTEMVSNQAELFEKAQRVRVEWKTKVASSWPDIVDWLEQDKQALCIVNLKRHAYDLAKKAQEKGLEGIFHLSTALCPQHRRDLLAQIVPDLKAGKPCRVIATQCVEAGVDLDFPNVYRALAPLDAIAQAAGRCNRNDMLAEKGLLMVFVPEEEKYPTKAYQQAAELTRVQLGNTGSLDLDHPDTYRSYYHSLYNLAATTDPELENHIKTHNFEGFAKEYRLIENNAVNVVVPYNEAAKALMEEARQMGVSGDWIRRVRGYTVGFFLDAKLGAPAFLEPLFYRFERAEAVPDWFLCRQPDGFGFQTHQYYHPMFGLMAEGGGF